jgi:hypothetical protein
MRTQWLLAFTLVTVSIESNQSAAQILTNKSPLRVATGASPQLKVFVAPPQPLNALLPGGRSVDLSHATTNALDGGLKEVSATLLKPGVYTTTPYACVVIVPEPHLDERFVVKPLGPSASMPVLKPELHFIPLHSK